MFDAKLRRKPSPSKSSRQKPPNLLRQEIPFAPKQQQPPKSCRKYLAESKSTAKYKVVVTHHVPSFQLSSPEFEGSSSNGAFNVELEDYIKESGINYWIYGHSHRNIDKTIGSTQCLSNQLGYVFAGEHQTFNHSAVITL